MNVVFAIEDDDQIQHYSVFVDGDPRVEDQPVDDMTFTGEYAWTPPFDAQPGDTFVIRVVARDYAGNQGSAALTVSVPTGPVLIGDQELSQPSRRRGAVSRGRNLYSNLRSHTPRAVSRQWCDPTISRAGAAPYRRCRPDLDPVRLGDRCIGPGIRGRRYLPRCNDAKSLDGWWQPSRRGRRRRRFGFDVRQCLPPAGGRGRRSFRYARWRHCPHTDRRAARGGRWGNPGKRSAHHGKRPPRRCWRLTVDHGWQGDGRRIDRGPGYGFRPPRLRQCRRRRDRDRIWRDRRWHPC